MNLPLRDSAGLVAGGLRSGWATANLDNPPASPIMRPASGQWAHLDGLWICFDKQYNSEGASMSI